MGFLSSKNPSEEKAEVLDKYAQENLDMRADVNVNDDPQRKPDYKSSPLGKRYCECNDHIEDVRRLAEDCMCHQCCQEVSDGTQKGTGI